MCLFSEKSLQKSKPEIQISRIENKIKEWELLLRRNKYKYSTRKNEDNCKFNKNARNDIQIICNAYSTTAKKANKLDSNPEIKMNITNEFIDGKEK